MDPKTVERTMSVATILSVVANDKSFSENSASLKKFLEAAAKTDATAYADQLQEERSRIGEQYRVCCQYSLASEMIGICSDMYEKDKKNAPGEVLKKIGSTEPTSISEYDVQNPPAYSAESGISHDDYHRILGLLHLEYAKLIQGK